MNIPDEIKGNVTVAAIVVGVGAAGAVAYAAYKRFGPGRFRQRATAPASEVEDSQEETAPLKENLKLIDED